jgi:hypothetical protein
VQLELFYCNLEVTVENGSGGRDPYMQCIAYYIKSHPSDSCLLLELCCTTYSVSGIIYTDRQVICDPLSPTSQLLRNQDFVVCIYKTV